ncbi:ribosome-recycling factor, mitochondrial [Eurosta solidaginis]|uniref:ribosome-recycling factor, mitochondrial n=1 Tax=Eurosta solidaginis TaxID=178769 RepID=UPI003530B250
MYKNTYPIIRGVLQRELRSFTTFPGIKQMPLVACQLQTQIQTTCICFPQVRCYAKSKDKKKEKGKKSGAKVEINETQLREVLDLDALNGQMQKAIQQMKDDFIKQLSIRSTSGAVEKLRVLVDGAEHELQELGQISRKNPKTIVVNMIAFPQTIPDVLKALENSGMNLNPQQDGTTLFIPIPKVTKEHRESLSKNAKSLFIKYRDSIRDIQNIAIKKIKKQSDISKDDNFAIQTQIAAIADRYIAEADKLLATKQKELLGDS